MKSKINSRLLGISILAMLAAVISITMIHYRLFQKQVSADLSITARLLRDSHYFESPDMRKEPMEMSLGGEELRLTWIGEDGQVLYDNGASAERLGNHGDRPEVQEAFQYGEGDSVRKSDTLNQDTFYDAVLLDNGTVLRVAMNAQSLWAVFLSAAPIIAVILLFIIAMCVGISHVLTGQLLKPIEIMAENLENADYSAPYKELEPLSEMLRTEHTNVLSAAKARQDFTANVSHELKTPLTAISGYAELLESGMVGGEEQKHFYREIRKNAERLLSLINDIIRLSELDRKNHEPVLEKLDLYETAEECMEALSLNAGQRGISLSLQGVPVSVRGNKEMLKELLENLVQNAIRYNNPGGEVRVFVGQKAGRAVLSVRDNGIGIPASEQQRVFERFYRVDKSRSKATGGTGLGLAIVKHIAELHDAEIELESEEGVGTDIRVWF